MDLGLTPDQVLATTRAVRRRLDLTRPVEREIIEECLLQAQQAPRASNRESRRFIVVTEPAKRLALAELWRRGMQSCLTAAAVQADQGRSASQASARILEGVTYLGEHLHEVPVHVIPCLGARVENLSAVGQAGHWGTIAPATWSFMLAARARGLGTCWTSFHLPFEREAAEILEIPFERVTQTALIPTAYTVGPDFKPALREPLDHFVGWESWA